MEDEGILLGTPVAILVLWMLRRFLSTATRLPALDRRLARFWMPAAVVWVGYLLLGKSLHLDGDFLDDVFILLVIAQILQVVWQLRDYPPARTVGLALVPYAAMLMLAVVWRQLALRSFKEYNNGIDMVGTFVFFWLVGLFFVARSQKKRLAAEAKRRARDVMLATKPEYLKPEGVIAGGKECDLCPFTAACGRIRADAVPVKNGDDAVDELTADSIAALAVLAWSAKEESDRKAAEARQIQDEIKAMLISVKRRRLEHGGVRVIWSPLKGRPSYDDKAIRAAAAAAGVDIEKFSRVGDPSDRMEITRSRGAVDVA